MDEIIQLINTVKDQDIKKTLVKMYSCEDNQTFVKYIKSLLNPSEDLKNSDEISSRISEDEKRSLRAVINKLNQIYSQAA